MALLAIGLCVLASRGARAGEDGVLTRAEEARQRALEEERDTLVREIVQRRLMRLPPETVHGAAFEHASVRDAVDRMLLLDQALRVTELGGVENLDRLFLALAGIRGRAPRDAARAREVLADRLALSREERAEAARTELALSRALAEREPKPANARPLAGPETQRLDPPGSAPGQPSVAALDYIPVSPEELLTLRARHLADGRAKEQSWYDRLHADPLADQKWRERELEHQQRVARMATTHEISRGPSYQLGVWLQDTWKNKEPIGLALIAIVLAGLGVAGVVLYQVLRSRR
jgi:hypothetical protein